MQEYDITKPFYKSKKWYAMVIGVLIPVFNYVLGLDICPDVIWSVVAPIAAYILGQAYVDAKH